jgi:ankyrin repeat protein
MVASFQGSTQVAKLLVDRGAEVSVKSKVGMTALINAAWRGKLDIVRLLIENGADVNAQTESGSTALEMSKYGGKNSAEVARVLREAGAER